ncbi:MAG: signal peptidase I [Planctomycetes bacterium]|nr:signal peptidase I [Planctomycetota bacterium]
MGKYPKAWMNMAAAGVRIAALGSVTAAVLYFMLRFDNMKSPEGDGMSPAFPAGSGILVKTGHGRLSRGDVVLYRPAPSMALLGRIAATGGEKVALENGRLLINGATAGKYVFFAPAAPDKAPAELEAVEVNPGNVFILNDNLASSSLDSRAFGQVPVSAIMGVVVMTY